MTRAANLTAQHMPTSTCPIELKQGVRCVHLAVTYSLHVWPPSPWYMLISGTDLQLGEAEL